MAVRGHVINCPQVTCPDSYVVSAQVMCTLAQPRVVMAVLANGSSLHC